MHGLLDIKTLEHTMITNWTHFLDMRKLMAFAKNAVVEHHYIEATCTIQQLTISRFEFKSVGFILWIEVNIQNMDKKVKATIEAFLSDSELVYITSTTD